MFRYRHTVLKFSRSPYFDNHLSESIHTCTIETLYPRKLRTPRVHAIGGARGQNVVHSINRILALKFSRSPYVDSRLSESVHTCSDPRVLAGEGGGGARGQF